MGTEKHPAEGVMKEKFQHNRKPFHRWSVGSFGTTKGSITKKKSPQKSCQTAVTSRGVAHTLASTHREWGLHVEVPAASLVLRERTRVERHEDTLKGLM